MSVNKFSDFNDSDETPDSDDLAVIITRKRKSSDIPSSSKLQKSSQNNHRQTHTISDSDSDDSVRPRLRKLVSKVRSPFPKRATKTDEPPKPHLNFDPLKSPVIDDKLLHGEKCYLKNSDHLKNFQHDTGTGTSSSHKATSPQKQFTENIYGFYVTKVAGIDRKYNHEFVALNVKDILLPLMGTLTASIQFSYIFDIPWVMEQYPKEFRSCPLMLVHGEQRESKKALGKEASPFPNVTLCQANLPILYGTHHTKMMLLLYVEGLRVVIHTANMVPDDWHQKTQGVWMSPLFPKCPPGSTESRDSVTCFKSDLLLYLRAYNNPMLHPWCQHVQEHDFSAARVFLIGSVPGRHFGTSRSTFGHLKLRKILTRYGPDQNLVGPDWPVLGQFSSIGSLGSTPEDWLRGEWLTTMAARKATLTGHAQTSLKLIYPSVDDVRGSLEGYPAGAHLPYSYKTAQKQPYLRNFMHCWRSKLIGRTIASPHIKTYLRLAPDLSSIAWFLVTSANLSKAAWGMMEKKGEQLMVRSYELGVLFLPAFHDCETSFPLSGCKAFPVPFDVKLTKYTEKDKPWIWDIPHIHAPDRNGNMWCPPLK